MNNFELIKQATELFKFKKIEDSRYEFDYLGLLVPSYYVQEDGKEYQTVFSYGRPALAIHICNKMSPNKDNTFACVAVISSIDDAGCTIFGPITTKEKSMSQCEKVKKYFEDQCMFCPSKDELEEVMNKFGLYPEFW